MGIVTAIIEILSLKLSSFEMINFLVSSIVRISTMRNLLFDNILTIFDTIISVLLCTIDAINKINLLDNLFKEILVRKYNVYCLNYRYHMIMKKIKKCLFIFLVF